AEAGVPGARHELVPRPLLAGGAGAGALAARARARAVPAAGGRATGRGAPRRQGGPRRAAVAPGQPGAVAARVRGAPGPGHGVEGGVMTAPENIVCFAKDWSEDP